MELLVTLAVLAIITSLAGPAVGNFFDKRRLVAGMEAIRNELIAARVEALSSSSNLRVRAAGGVSVVFDRASDDDWRVGVSVNLGCDPTDAPEPQAIPSLPRCSTVTNVGCDPRETDPSEDNACYVIIDDGDTDDIVDGVDTDFDGVLDSTEEDIGDRVLKVLSSADYPGVKMVHARFFGGAPNNKTVFNSVRGTATVNGLRYNGTVKLESEDGLRLHVVVSSIGRVFICSPSQAHVSGYPRRVGSNNCDM